jgi:hypothetical protein
MVTNPISANQIVSVDIDYKCLDVTCKDLPHVLQAIVDKVCDEPDFTTLDFGCVTPATTLLGTLQNTLTAVDTIGCGAGGGAPVTNATTLTVAGITACSSEIWGCDSSSCFDLTNACDPGEITVGLLFQKLINRNVAYANTIKSLCTRLEDAENAIAALQLSVTTIQTSCCP